MNIFRSFNRSITILMVYLHKNSYISCSMLCILYYFYIGLGIQTIFQYSSIYQQDNFYKASKVFLGGQLVLQMQQYQNSYNTIFVQFIPIITFGALYTALNFIKYFFAHPKFIVIKIALTLIEIGTFILVFIFCITFMFNIYDYVIEVVLTGQSQSVIVKIINLILLVFNTVLTSFFMWKYSVCYQQFGYNKLYMFRSEIYFTLQILYIISSSVLRYLFYSQIIIMQSYSITCNVLLVIYITMKRIFSLTYESLYIYGLVIFFAFLNIACAIIGIFDFLDPNTVNSDLLFMLGIVFSIISTVLCCIIQRQIFKVNIIQNLPLQKVNFNKRCKAIIPAKLMQFFSKIKTVGTQIIDKINNKLFKKLNKGQKREKTNKKYALPVRLKKSLKKAEKYHSVSTHLHYGISKDFLFNLLAYYGPEFCGVVNDPDHDVMTQCEFKQLTQGEYQLFIPRIQQAEDCMEKCKLLYENIYANIYFTYAMCGQTLQTFTLLDIEQSLPVPQLITYMSQWKTAEDAFTTILYMMRNLSHINEMLGVDGMEYEFTNQLFNKVKHRFSKNIQQVLEQNGRKLPENIQLSQISQNDHISGISENEYNIWNNHYSKHSSEAAHGGLYLIDHKDYEAQKYLFKHYDANVNDQSLIFIYLPSLTSISQVTGNLHRLCWNNDNSNLRTYQQRRTHIIALISLSRIMFPSKQRIYSQYTYPFVSQWAFTSLSKYSNVCKIKPNIKVTYMRDFTINIVKSRYQYRSNKILYQLAPILLPIIQSEHVQSHELQYFLTELFVMKLVQFGYCNHKAKLFLDSFHNQHLSVFQQIQMMHIPESLDNTKLKQILQNQNYNMDQNIVRNALAVLFGSGSLDYNQVSNINLVINTLQRNQYYYDKQYRSYFYGYTKYLFLKLKLYTANLICNHATLQEMLNFLSDIMTYQDSFINILKVYNQEESIISTQIYKFLSIYYEHLVKLIPLKCTHELESDQLQLLHTIEKDDVGNYQNQVDSELHVQYSYIGLTLISNQLHDQPFLNKYFNFYTTTKLSNIVTILEKSLVYNFLHDREELFLNPYKYNQLIDSAQSGLKIILRLISTNKIQFKEQQDVSLENKSNNSSFSFSSNSSSLSESDIETEEIQRNANIFQQKFNMESWDFELISHNDIFFFKKGQDENLLMQNYDASNNTPEFILAVINYDNERSFKKYNTFFTLVILGIFQQLHKIKNNDNSFRSLSTANYLIQSIQQKEFQIEQQIIYFLQNLIDLKKTEFNIKETSIPQFINSLNEINTEITKLLYIYLSVLHREYLSEDHIYIIKKEMDRSIKMLYGYPDINYNQYTTDKERLIAICQIYLGLQQSMIPIVLQQIEQLPRSGGIYHNNMTYIFPRHKTWRYVFLWEKTIVKEQNNQQKAQDDKLSTLPSDDIRQNSVKCTPRSIQSPNSEVIQESSKQQFLGNHNFISNKGDQQKPLNQNQSISMSLEIQDNSLQVANEKILPSSHTTSIHSAKSSKSIKVFFNKIKMSMKQIKKYIIIPILVSLVLTLFFGIMSMTMILQQIQIFKTKFQIIEQTTSESLYVLGQVGNQIQMIQKENPVYITQDYFLNAKLSQYQQLNNKLFKNYLLLKSYFTGSSVKSVYNKELKEKLFQYDLNKIQTTSVSGCNVENYFYIKWFKPKAGLRFILSQIMPELNSQFVYNYYFNNPVRVDALEKRFNYTFNNTITQVNVMELLYIYTMTLNCQSNLLMNAMYIHNTSQDVQSIVRDIQKLQLEYQNVFTNAFSMIRNDYYVTIKYYTNMIIYILTILIMFQMYILMHYILINYQTKILIDNIDKGSIISRISRLSVSKLEQLLKQYKQKISQKHNHNFQAQHTYQNQQHMIPQRQLQQYLHNEIETQKVDEQFNKFWDLATRLFKHSVHNMLLFPIFISTILFIIGYALIARSITSPIMPSSINIQNQFYESNQQTVNNISKIEVFANYTNLLQYKIDAVSSKSNYSTHVMFNSVYYTLEWVKYFNANPLSVNNLEFFIMIPFPQVDYVKLYIQISSSYAPTSIKIKMENIVEQLGKMVVQTIDYQSQNIINNEQLSETYQKIKELYNIKQYNSTYVQYLEESAIISTLNEYLQKSTIHYDVYIGIGLYTIYTGIQTSCLIVLFRYVFLYMYKPYNINFNKKNKQVRVISQLLLNRFTFIFMMFVMMVNLVTIILKMFNLYMFFRFTYLSVNQFNVDMQKFAMLIYQRITPLEFTLNLLSLLIILVVYDVYSYNLLVTVCSLGKADKTTFVTPHHVGKRKTQINFYILKVLIGITTIITIGFVQFYVYIIPTILDQKNFYFSQTVSQLNQLGIIMQPTFNYQPNVFYTNLHSTYKFADMGIQLLEQTGNLSKLANVINKQQIQNNLINEYIDKIWESSIGDLNKAVLNYQEQYPPSFIYGVLNNSQFEKYQLPRNKKFGEQLTEETNSYVQQPLLTMLIMYINYAKLTTYYPQFNLYITLLSDFSLYQTAELSLAGLTNDQKSVAYMAYVANKYIPYINNLLNLQAEEQVFSQLQSTIRQLYIYFFTTLCVITVLLVIVVLIFLRIVYITRTFLLKNNLFTSLFLKRHFLLSNHGLSSRTSMSSKLPTDFNSHNQVTPKQAMIQDNSDTNAISQQQINDSY